MKTTHLAWGTALLLGAAFASCTEPKENKPGELAISGQLTNLEDTLFVYFGDETRLDTMPVTDGKFQTKLHLDSISNVTFLAKNGFAMSFIGVPGEEVRFEGDVKTRFDIDGSDFYADYHEVDLIKEKLTRDNGPQAIMDFLKQHPDNEAAIVLVRILSDMEPDMMEEALAQISDKVRQGRMKRYIDLTVEEMKAAMARESAVRDLQAEGREVPDFTLNDINGNPLNLSSLRGKYVVLDFWGSWCGWCIKGMPEMKKYYEKYAGKFEILGIDCSDSDEAWKNAVKEHGLPWLHVYNTDDSSVLEDYGIEGFPTKIVLDPEGRIVRTVVGEDPAFYDLLDELFGK